MKTSVARVTVRTVLLKRRLEMNRFSPTGGVR